MEETDGTYEVVIATGISARKGEREGEDDIWTGEMLQGKSSEGKRGEAALYGSCIL